MVGRTQHHDCATFCQRHDKTRSPGYAVGMNDDRLNIVQRYSPLLLAIKADDKKSAISGEMEIIRGNIDNAVHGQPFGSEGWHIMDNDWLTRPRIKNTAKFVNTNLAGF
mgnify:CR=1 FL=1